MHVHPCVSKIGIPILISNFVLTISLKLHLVVLQLKFLLYYSLYLFNHNLLTDCNKVVELDRLVTTCF